MQSKKSILNPLRESRRDYLVLVEPTSPITEKTSYIVSQVALQGFYLLYFHEDEFYVLYKEDKKDSRMSLTNTLTFGSIQEVKEFLMLNEGQEDL